MTEQTEQDLADAAVSILWDRMTPEARQGVLREIPIEDENEVARAVQRGRRLRGKK